MCWSSRIATFFVVAIWATLFWLAFCIFQVANLSAGSTTLSLGAALISGAVFLAMATLTAGLAARQARQAWAEAAYEAVIDGSIISLVIAGVGILVAMPFASVSWTWTMVATALAVVIFIGLFWLFAVYNVGGRDASVETRTENDEKEAMQTERRERAATRPTWLDDSYDN
jgi:uncharacterized protein YacL